MTDGGAVRACVERVRPEVVIHAAAESDVDRCEREPDHASRANVQATRHLIEAAEAVRARFLHVSSDYVFDGLKGSPYVETDAPHPVSHYGRTKLAAEEAVRRSTLAWLIVRPSTLFGPGRATFIDTIIRLAEAGTAVPVFADQTTSPSYTVDVAEGIARLLETDATGIVHLANEGAASRLAVARATLEQWGLASAGIRETLLQQAGLAARRPPNSSLAVDRIRSLTGWTPRPWRAAIDDYLRWKRQSASGNL